MRPLSARNPRIRRLDRLVRQTRERADRRALVVEGPVLLREAITRGARIVDVYVAADAAEDPRIIEVLDDRPDPSPPAWIVPAGLLDRIGDAVTSRGILAVVEQPDPPVADRGFVLVLARIADPGNTGTLIRAAAAAGAAAVVTIGGADPTAPKVVRASAGTIFSMPVLRYRAAADAVSALRDRGYRVLGAVPRNGIGHTEARLDDRTAVMLGNEAHGLDAEELAELDGLITIEMAGDTESLNVAMAGTVLCFEARRHGGIEADPVERGAR